MRNASPQPGLPEACALVASLPRSGRPGDRSATGASLAPGLPGARVAGTARLLVVLLAALLLAGCTPAPPPVVLVSIDSLRADVPGADRGGRKLTPRLDALADESLVFTRATSPAPWTTPAMTSVMTGLDAPVHGVEEHDRALARSVPTLAEKFREAGYRTAAYVPAVTLRPEYGFERGFEIYDLENFGHHRLSSPSLSGKVLARLEEWREEPFFIWVHLWDPHYNYIPPPPFDRTFRRGEKPAREDVQCLKWVERPVEESQAEYLRGQYEGEVLYTDGFLGQILDQLDALGLAQRAIVAVLADHGESFLEHGWLGHTNRLDETLIHVPLMIRLPGAAPRRIDARAATAGIGRTLLEKAGLEGAEGFGAVEELPLDGGETAAVVSQTLRRGCLTSLSGRRFKYILDQRDCAERLYDLERDPGEQVDLSAAEPERLASMRAELRGRLERLDGLGVPRAMLPQEIVEQAEKRLRSIGYVGGGAGKDTDREVGCAKLSDAGRRDAFGDAAPERCPAEGARRCLSELAGGRGG